MHEAVYRLLLPSPLFLAAQAARNISRLTKDVLGFSEQLSNLSVSASDASRLKIQRPLTSARKDLARWMSVADSALALLLTA